MKAGPAALGSARSRGVGHHEEAHRRTVEIGGRNLQIVGLVHDSTALAGQANVFLTVSGAQKLLFSGQR